MTRFSVVAVAVMMMVTMILLPPPMLPLALLTPMAAALVVLVVDCAHDEWTDSSYVLVGRSGCGARARRDAMR